MPRFDKEYQEYLRGECKDYNQSLINALAEMEKGNEEIEGLEKKIELLKEMLDDTVGYGFKQNRKVADMTRQINELTQEIEDYNIQSTGGARRWKGSGE